MLTLTIITHLVFANNGAGDNTFSEIVKTITGYLTGSLGMVFVLVGFLGAAAAMAGFASMKVMFPIFGLTLALKFGPKILDSIFGNDGTLQQAYTLSNFSIFDIVILLGSTYLFILAIFGDKKPRPVK